MKPIWVLLLMQMTGAVGFISSRINLAALGYIEPWLIAQGAVVAVIAYAIPAGIGAIILLAKEARRK